MQSQEYQRAFRKSQGLPPRITVPSKNNPLGKTIGESLIFLLGLSNMEDFDKVDWEYGLYLGYYQLAD